MMNLLHDIDPGDANGAHVVIEIPRGSKNKYEIDKNTGRIALDRAMHTAQDYPVDYGFFPRTLWDDGDALDACVITTYPVFPGIIARVRLVGVIETVDDGEGDDKILCVPQDDPRFDEIKDIEDVNPHRIKEIAHFFETYKYLQNKKVIIKGFGNAQAARASFNRAREMYDENN